MADLKVNIEKVISAPIEIVFDAWLNPKILPKFMMGMPDMPETVVAEIDAREGGISLLSWIVGEKLTAFREVYRNQSP